MPPINGLDEEKSSAIFIRFFFFFFVLDFFQPQNFCFIIFKEKIADSDYPSSSWESF